MPGIFAPLMSYLGPEGFFPLVALLGAGMAAADRFLRTNSPTRTIVAVGLMNSILYYERGLEGLVLTARGIVVFVVLAPVLGAVEAVARRSAGRRMTFRTR